jgi:hypothetical protein
VVCSCWNGDASPEAVLTVSSESQKRPIEHGAVVRVG